MHHRPGSKVFALALLSFVLLAACKPTLSERATAAVSAFDTIAVSTPTLMYSFPQPATPLPTTTQAPRPELASGSGSQLAFTVLHTNDSRGYLDPCG